jgi:hypothetical protein
MPSFIRLVAWLAHRCGGLVVLLDGFYPLVDIEFLAILLVVLLQSVIFALCWVFYFNGEFDPGSGRTLAACLTHASRTVTSGLALVDQWRTGE